MLRFMSCASLHSSSDAAIPAGLDVQSLRKAVAAKDLSIAALQDQLASAQRRIEWFKRQMFGAKSERFAPLPDPQQMHLGQIMDAGQVAGVDDSAPSAVAPEVKVSGHQRRARKTDFADDGLEASFFDAAKVPVQIIHVANPVTAGLTPEQYEVIGQKVSHRLAQRPGSHVVLKYVRPVVKLLSTQEISAPAAPVGVLEGSRADVSFIAGMMVDKFAWHLPLYRQHQRLQAQGFRLSRQWLTQLMQDGAGLLEPIYEAQMASIRASRVVAMDEVPIKAARVAPGKMGSAYFWPIYGELEEVCFPFFESRRKEHVAQALGLQRMPNAVLLSDGYAAYDRYTSQAGVTHALCWAHTRRCFFEAKGAEPEFAAQALTQIAALYRIEEEIREQKLQAQAKRMHRLLYSKPRVDAFFAWVDAQFERQGLLPSNPLTKALAYARERRSGLEVYLSDEQVPIDTNHLERALRVIPMGKKAWLFCWTELGAKQAGILQSLIVTCRLHNIDPYTYLVDVLQRVAVQPASKVAELTPRLWKQHFAAEPMKSDCHSNA